MNLKQFSITAEQKQGVKKALLCALPAVAIAVSVWGYGGVHASNLALSHANLNRDQVSFVRFELDLDDFIPRYDVSWHEGMRETEYTIHAITGQIMEIDFD